MKRLKRFTTTLMAGILSFTVIGGSITASADASSNYYTERESLYTTDDGDISLVSNDEASDAEYFPATILLNKTYLYCEGNFADKGYDENGVMIHDSEDWYSFGIGRTSGRNGQIAIKMENIPYGDNYDIYLYDSSMHEIDSSEAVGNHKELVKTPEISSYTNYYIRVVGTTISNPDNSYYRLIVEDHIKTATKTVSLSPSTLTTTAGSWSTNAYRDQTSLPSDAKVVSATISATKGTTSTYGNMLRVKLGNGNYTVVTWSSGNIQLPELIGENCSNYWYAGFTGYVLSGSSLISMKNFKMTITYEYDSLINYMS